MKKINNPSGNICLNSINSNVFMHTCNEHYNKSLGKKEVSRMTSNSNGVRYDGEFWIIREIQDAYRGYQFPARATDYDKYVAVNFVFHKLHGRYSDEQILEIAYRLFFAGIDVSHGEVYKLVSGSC